jgi:argininosuccinate synthase
MCPLTFVRSRLAHIDLEGLVMDSQVRELRDQLMRAWSRQLYHGLYFSPEREYAESSLILTQHNVTGQVRMMAYKGNVRQSLNVSNY